MTTLNREVLIELVDLIDAYQQGTLTVEQFTRLREIFQVYGKICEFYSTKHEKCISYYQLLEHKLFNNFVI